MRLAPLLLSALVVAPPVQAQVAAIAPAPSVLFAAARAKVTHDTAPERPRRTVLEEAGLGAGAGLLLGVALGAWEASAHPCACDDPGLEPIVGGFLGSVVGFVVGGSIADERRQRAKRGATPPLPAVAVTENGTPLTGDSTRLVGHDRHGVRGGIAGALMGGAIGYAIPHGIYSLQHSGGYATDGANNAGGPSALAVGVSTLSGAVSGYLIAAMLSRR
jgi:hypothetical protein